MPDSMPTLAAFRTARANAAAAAAVEAEMRHMAIYDARDAGMSIRAIAALLRVSKSTVARHLVGSGPDAFAESAWMTPDAYVNAANAAWPHDTSQHINRAPFTVLPDGSRKLISLAAAQADRASGDGLQTANS